MREVKGCDGIRRCGWVSSVLAGCLLSVVASAQGGNPAEQEVTVSNVSVSRHGAFLKVTYDLATSDGAPTHVFASFSEDGGATFSRSLRTASGDINKDVSPGLGRWFVWDFSADGVSGLLATARVRVQGGLYPGMEREFGGIVFCWIPPGTFLMGRYAGEQDSYSSEDPQHLVTFAQGFWMSKYEVTQAQWHAVMGTRPFFFPGDNRPVESVSWNDIRNAGGYLEKLNAAHPGHGVFRLPSEAEWEYAYRAGTTTRFYWGDDPGHTEIGAYVSWYPDNASSDTKDVGGKLPNAWGLHDMAGNVREWCEDDWHDNYTGAPTDGSAWVNSPRGPHRLLRGGAVYSFLINTSPARCRAAYRYYCSTGVSLDIMGAFTGFRIVLASDSAR